MESVADLHAHVAVAGHESNKIPISKCSKPGASEGPTQFLLSVVPTLSMLERSWHDRSISFPLHYGLGDQSGDDCGANVDRVRLLQWADDLVLLSHSLSRAASMLGDASAALAGILGQSFKPSVEVVATKAAVQEWENAAQKFEDWQPCYPVVTSHLPAPVPFAWRA